MKRADPDYGITEKELSSSEDETESDFENFVSPLSSGEKYTCDERTFLVYESNLRELLASCVRCRSQEASQYCILNVLRVISTFYFKVYS